MNEPRHPDIEVQLTGRDSNAGTLICAVIDAIKDARRDGRLTREEAKESMDAFRAKAYSGDYTNVIATCAEWVVVS